jgi:hypothetical protein
MNFKNKITLILTFSFILILGSYFIISSIFNNLENSLFEKCRLDASTGAEIMSQTMILMIDSKMISEKNIFDTNYIAIKDTKPIKYHTKYDTLFDKYLTKTEDAFLKDKDLIYAILIDKNAYIPTHNSKYSKVDSKHPLLNRTKRIFKESKAIKIAAEWNGSDKQYALNNNLIIKNNTIRILYSRDTGESIWNISSPVYLNGKHWGSFLIGVSMKGVNIIKNQMIIMIIIILAVIISLTMLAGLSVMPRSLFKKTE